ncbi:MAG: nucleoside 2-deoxyribosyltransferase [Methanohalobium sp.]|uniref:nucleoside 2-deoxyribosyltransferase n=1 Tax=Methanohalobium sp. TaxID=2837493 RepID=UPI00397C7411
MDTSKKVYIAGPLFSEGELDFNTKLKEAIEKKGFAVYLPQENSEDNVHMRHEHKQNYIFQKNVEIIDDSDIIIAVLDGADVDSGTSWEIGYAYAKGKSIFGLRTDFRTLGSEGMINLMIDQSADAIAFDIPGVLEILEQ